MLPSIPQGTIVKVVCAGNGDDVAIIELVDRPGTMIRMPVGTVTPHLLPTRKEGGGVRGAVVGSRGIHFDVLKHDRLS